MLLVPAATEAPVKKRQGATDVSVLTDSLENTVKWVGDALLYIQKACKFMQKRYKCSVRELIVKLEFFEQDTSCTVKTR